MPIRRKPPLTVPLILKWADAHKRRIGKWPSRHSGPVVAGFLGDTWSAIHAALREGRRGLPGGTTLAGLLVKERGARIGYYAPDLTEKQILAWADRYRQRTGRWPHEHGGPVHGEPGEDWHNVDEALRRGGRGLAGGSSLSRLLARHRGVRNLPGTPPLTAEQVLRWADGHRRKAGAWPKTSTGPVAGAAGEDWKAIDESLRQGLRGLPGGSSLARLLAAERGVRNQSGLPLLTERKVLAWARAHKRRTGRWPGQSSGPIPEAPGETWGAVGHALREGLRGFPGGSSLAKLLGRAGRQREKGRS
jgi:hypothetical protein